MAALKNQRFPGGARRTWLAGLLLCAALPAAVQAASDAVAAQRRIEAAYLYKFGSYITWPADVFPSGDSPLVIGVAGDDDMADELAALVTGRNVNGRPVQVRRIRAGQNTANINLLFIAADADQGDSLINAARNKPTVTVTEGPDGLDRGADMTFVLVNDRVRFDIALDTTTRDGVKMSSQLLSVADKVTGAGMKP